jgi:hypothetical protein
MHGVSVLGIRNLRSCVSAGSKASTAVGSARTFGQAPWNRCHGSTRHETRPISARTARHIHSGDVSYRERRPGPFTLSRDNEDSRGNCTGVGAAVAITGAAGSAAGSCGVRAPVRIELQARLECLGPLSKNRGDLGSEHVLEGLVSSSTWLAAFRVPRSGFRVRPRAIKPMTGPVGTCNHRGRSDRRSRAAFQQQLRAKLDPIPDTQGGICATSCTRVSWGRFGLM